MKTIVLLSGEIAAGKSAIAEELIRGYGFRRISTGLYLQKLASERKLGGHRNDLKDLGDRLDIETNGEWVISAFDNQSSEDSSGRWLLDSIRRDFQIPWFKARYGNAVLHAHVTAPDDVLRRRYESRERSGGEYASGTSYEVAKSGPTEEHVKSLASICDLILDSDLNSPGELALKIFEAIRRTKGEL